MNNPMNPQYQNNAAFNTANRINNGGQGYNNYSNNPDNQNNQVNNNTVNTHESKTVAAPNNINYPAQQNIPSHNQVNGNNISVQNSLVNDQNINRTLNPQRQNVNTNNQSFTSGYNNYPNTVNVPYDSKTSLFDFPLDNGETLGESLDKRSKAIIDKQFALLKKEMEDKNNEALNIVYRDKINRVCRQYPELQEALINDAKGFGEFAKNNIVTDRYAPPYTLEQSFVCALNREDLDVMRDIANQYYKQKYQNNTQYPNNSPNINNQFNDRDYNSTQQLDNIPHQYDNNLQQNYQQTNYNYNMQRPVNNAPNIVGGRSTAPIGSIYGTQSQLRDLISKANALSQYINTNNFVPGVTDKKSEELQDIEKRIHQLRTQLNNRQ